MSNGRKIEFGYNSVSGDRQEVIRHRYFVSDLEHVLDIACQGMKYVLVPDHLAIASEYRLECWTLLTWIAARYPGVTVGGQVMCNSYRNPALVAKMGASLQAISSGRFVLGYGAGWHGPEYAAYGYEFPSTRVRIEMLEEGIQLIKAMWAGSPASFSGKHYQVADAYCEPVPDPDPPIMVGGKGKKYTLAVVARQADWWTVNYDTIDELRSVVGSLREHCQAEGRDFGSIRKVYSSRVFINRSHSAALKSAEEWKDRLPHAVAGDPSSVREELARLAEELDMGVFAAAFPRYLETEDMKLFIDEVVPAFA